MKSYLDILSSENLKTHLSWSSSWIQSKEETYRWLEMAYDQNQIHRVPSLLLAFYLQDKDWLEGVPIWSRLDEEAAQRLFEGLFFYESLDSLFPTIHVPKVLEFLKALEEEGQLYHVLEKLEDETLTVLFQSLITLKPVGTFTVKEESEYEDNLPRSPNLQFYYEVNSSIPEGEHLFIQRMMNTLYEEDPQFLEFVLNCTAFWDRNETLEKVHQFRKARLEEEGFLEKYEAVNTLHRLVAQQPSCFQNQPSESGLVTLESLPEWTHFLKPFPTYTRYLKWRERYQSEQENIDQDIMFLTQLVYSARHSLGFFSPQEFEENYLFVLLCLNLGLEFKDTFQTRVIFDCGLAYLTQWRHELLCHYLKQFEEGIMAEKIIADGSVILVAPERLLSYFYLDELRNWILRQEQNLSSTLAPLLEWRPVVWFQHQKFFLAERADFEKAYAMFTRSL